MEKKNERSVEALERLRQWIKPGDTVYTILRHVSKSGMTRSISPVINTAGQTVDIDWAVARLFGSRIDQKHGGLIRSGCGMDMGFDLVHHLSYKLFPDGFTCTGQFCPSNDHVNGDRNYTTHQHASGGYALRQRWL